ncbi:hypothetical protein SMICM304S_04590 [Streptomyces microflavus]
MPRLALYALVVCVLAVAAAVVSFVQGSLLGIIWVLIAALVSGPAAEMRLCFHRPWIRARSM